MVEGNQAGENVSASIPGLQQYEVSSTEAWELLQRVVSSQELRRAVRLRDLVLYLGTRSLKDNETSLREQEIGAAVFGRDENYDTNIDNIVRVNVSELRKRLHHYFQEEGAAETIVMEIPRGGYHPVFLARQIAGVPPPKGESAPADGGQVRADVAPVDAAAATSDLTPEDPARNWVSLALGGCLLLIAFAAIFYYHQAYELRTQLQPWRVDDARSLFWSHFFGTGQQVDIVTADTSYALAEDILQRPISLDDYLDYKYKDFANLPGLTQQTKDALNLVLDRNTGSIGDFEAAERVMELDAHSPAINLASARSYTPASIKKNNVILIGSRESNPWVELYKDRMNFQVEYDPSRHSSYVVNRAPLPGEASVYQVGQDKDRDYSVVAFVPNLSPSRFALIIGGTDSQGTRAAGEFITSSEGLAAVRERVPADRYPYFEVLLASSRLEGTTLHTSIQAFRGYGH
jgi:hypothetical protein